VLDGKITRFPDGCLVGGAREYGGMGWWIKWLFVVTRLHDGKRRFLLVFWCLIESSWSAANAASRLLLVSCPSWSTPYPLCPWSSRHVKRARKALFGYFPADTELYCTSKRLKFQQKPPPLPLRSCSPPKIRRHHQINEQTTFFQTVCGKDRESLRENKKTVQYQVAA